MCKNSPHFESKKCTIWHLLKPASNVQEFTPLWDSKVYNLTFVEAFFKCARNHPTWKQQKVTCHFALVSVTCQWINQQQFQPSFILTGLCADGIKLNLIAFFPPHSCMQLSNWGLVRTAFDESGCVYQALDWCQTPSGYLFWLTLDYHPSLFAP